MIYRHTRHPHLHTLSSPTTLFSYLTPCSSVETRTPLVARAAAEAGVHLLNDVTGFTDPEMVRVASEFGLPGCVMHMRGDPKHHREVSQAYGDIEDEVRTTLVARAQELAAQGVMAWLDPGFGFGRTDRKSTRLNSSH